ncbi:MAG TPA: NADH-quinone oxidoreductase subunit L [Kofleriaceae bacterium]|jgi:NADH-quinone oxidoreductase subunit L
MDPQSLTFLGLPALLWIPLLPLIGAAFNLILGRYFSKATAGTVAIAAVFGACVLSGVLVFWGLFQHPHDAPEALWQTGGYTQTAWTWLSVGSFKAELALHLDSLSAVMIMIITFVGTWIHIYSTGYMAHDPGYSRYFGYLNLFTGAMLILVLAANLPVMFIGWEGVGLCSFLLIGFWYENDAYAYAGRKAFVVNRIGDFAFLLGMFLLFWAVKSLDFEQLKNVADGAVYAGSDWGPHHAQVWGHERLAAAAGILLFIGACGKSAQLPLFVWLPDAMAGPTPVSALIHAATMVTAGVYMICRMSFMYTASTTAMLVVSTVGMLTALVAAFIAIAQTDLKKVLAYSTVSQLGFMFVAAGVGAFPAAIFHLMTHAFFKACLFLGAGSVMHGMEHGGSKTPGDIMTMGGLRKHMPITRWTFWISCLAISGIIPFAGFFSKDEILGGAWATHPPGWPIWYGKVLWAGLAIAAFGTAFYMWRLYYLVFGGNERSEEAKHAHESSVSMTSALAILAFFATIIGFIGVPHLELLHGGDSVIHALSRWLEPSLAHSWYIDAAHNTPLEPHETDATTIGLMAIALVVAFIGIGLAKLLYNRGPSKTVDRLVDGPLHGAWEASKHKLWFDEFYDATIVRPFKLVSRGFFEIVDRFIIDTVAVNGAAFVVGLFGRLARWFQNGQVQRYLVGVIVGAAAVFFVTDCHRHPTFDITRIGDEIKLHADTGAGVAGSGAKLHWHLNGSTDCAADKDKPSDPPDLVVRAGDTSARVALCVDDPIEKKMLVVTRLVPDAPEVKP